MDAIEQRRSDRHGVALHEAAHAVIGHALGAKIDSCVVNHGDWLCGATVVSAAGWGAGERAVYAVAGMVAMALFDAKIEGRVSYGCDPDLLSIRETFGAAASVELFNEAWRIAAELLLARRAGLFRLASWLEGCGDASPAMARFLIEGQVRAA